jgi:general secretion pathway protein G
MRSTLKKLQDRNREEGGFTLIELLVVIVIIGILAAVVVFAVGGIQDKGQDSADKADKRTLQTAEEAYFAENDAYATEAQLVPGYIAEQSTTHDICLEGGEYEVVPAGECD